MKTPVLNSEAVRIESLRRCEILDTPPEEAFEDLTRLAAHVCRVPMAAISFVAENRTWLKSAVGLPAQEGAREGSLCAQGILQKDVFVVRDTLADARFASSPMVVGEPHIRFYAGAPLLTSEGHAIGMMCVMDRSPRDLSDSQREALRSLGRQVMSQTKLRSVCSEHEKTELALRQSMERLQLVARATNDAVWDWDLTTDKVWWNEGFQTLFGYGPDKMAPTPEFWYRHIHSADRERILDGIKSVLSNGRQFWADEYRYRRANGTYAYVFDRGYVIHDEAHKPVRMVGAMVDITDRVRSAKALREGEQRFRSTFELAAVGIAHVAPNGQWLRVNRRLCDIVGYTREELLERRFQDITHPEDLAVDLDHVRRMLAGEIQRYSLEKRYIRKDGTLVWVNLTVALVRDPAGEPKYFISVVQDIQARKEAENAVRQAEEKYRGIFEKAMEGIFQIEPGGRVLTANPALARILGFESPRALLDQPLTFDPKQRAQFARIIKERGEVKEFELQFQRKDGSTIWLLANVRAVHDPEGRVRYYEGLAQEITERKRAEESLKQANLELSRSQEKLLKALADLKAAQMSLIQTEKMHSIGRLAAGVAHEVKNPLAIILQGIEYLSDSLPKHNGDANMAIQDMHEAVRRADSVIRGLLDFSATRELDLQYENVNAIVLKALTLVKHDLTKNHIITRTELCPGLPELLLDANKTEEVFVNLFLNAIHAMPRGGTLTVRSRLQHRPGASAPPSSSPSTSGTGVVVEVEDTGTGIPREKLARVFDPFFTTKPAGQGTGLGLTVAKTIIDLHGGTIDVGNRSEGGVKAVISFPVERKVGHGKKASPCRG